MLRRDTSHRTEQRNVLVCTYDPRAARARRPTNPPWVRQPTVFHSSSISPVTKITEVGTYLLRYLGTQVGGKAEFDRQNYGERWPIKKTRRRPLQKIAARPPPSITLPPSPFSAFPCLHGMGDYQLQTDPLPFRELRALAAPGHRQRTMSHLLFAADAHSTKGKIVCACGRTFKTDSALHQHQRDSPLHSAAAGRSSQARGAGEAQAGTGANGSRTPGTSRGGNIAGHPREPGESPKQPHADFRNNKTFPTFAGLPEENDISVAFYRTGDGFSYMPRKHWCFLAEIIEVEQFVRLRLIVRDKSGATAAVAFYTDGRGSEFAVQPGHTVAILYAHQHGFLDMTTGLRVEECSTVKARLPPTSPIPPVPTCRYACPSSYDSG